MAPSAAECRRIIRAADEAGVRLQVSFMHRYFEEVVKARQLIEEGAIGRPMAVRMRNATPGPDWDAWFYRRERVPGGVVMQLGVHGIDLLRHLFGDIAFLTAQAMLLRKERQLRDGTVVRPDNDDNALAIYRFASGVVATHEMSMSEVQGCDRFTMEIYGEQGTVWLRTVRGSLALYAPAYTGRDEWVLPELPSRNFGERHHRAFIDIVRGDAAADNTAIDGLATVLVADAIFRSSEARKEVPVPSPTETDGGATR
jgi:predicted dehydrogenase